MKIGIPMLRKLSRREKIGVYGALTSIFIFSAVQFGVFPALENRARLERVLQAKRDMVRQMLKLQTDYYAIVRLGEQVKDRFSKRSPGFTLFSFLDGLAGESGIKGHIAYMKPSSVVQKDASYKISRVEVKLQAVTMAKLSKYLHQVETSANMVTVRRASIVRTGKEKGLIDAVLQVETIEL